MTSSRHRAGPVGRPGHEPNGTSLGTVLGQFFDHNNTTVGGGHYLFNYSNVGDALLAGWLTGRGALRGGGRSSPHLALGLALR